MTQCGDCNRIMEGERLYYIGLGVWVCEDCLRTTIEDIDRFDEIKELTPAKEV